MSGGAGYYASSEAPDCRADVRKMAVDLATRYGPTVAAVLFYGSGLRTSDPGAILDLYVLVDSYRSFHHSLVKAGVNRALPPNVFYFPSNGPRNAGYKVAVIARDQFRARLTPDCRDTTLWARFCQPSALAYARDPEAGQWVAETLDAARAAAAWWAVRLGPERGLPRDYWAALFRHTYAAELRVEGGGRADTIFDYAPDWYDAALKKSPDVTDIGDALGYLRQIPAEEAVNAARLWQKRRKWGKTLNVLRLVKAVFTFENGVDYILWKLERHSGQHIELSRWQKRHPLLAAPFVLVRLIRRGVVR